MINFLCFSLSLFKGSSTRYFNNTFTHCPAWSDLIKGKQVQNDRCTDRLTDCLNCKSFFFQLSLSDVLFWWQINVLDLYLKCSLKLKSWWFTDHECTCASWQLSTYITMKTTVLTFLSRCLPSSSYQCYSIFPIYDRFQSSFYSGHNTCQFYVKI